MNDLEKAELAVRVAYADEAIHHQQANAKYRCAPVEKRAAIAEANAKASIGFEQKVLDAEAKLKAAYELHNL